MRLALGLLVVAVALAVATAAVRDVPVPPSPHCRSSHPLAGVYHPRRLVVKSRCSVASGVVTRVEFEEYDGDVHIDLRVDDDHRGLLSRGNDRVGGELVVEVVPEDRSRVRIPPVGARVTVVGPWVDDTHHGWMEIHPAWWISSGRIVPASPVELRRSRELLDDEERGDRGD